MTSGLDSFSGPTKWSSTDCRGFVKGADQLMHVGTATATVTGWDRVLFTDVFSDASADPTNLFDYNNEVAHEANSQCVNNIVKTRRTPDGDVIGNDNGNNLSVQAGLLGAGTMFTSKARVGATFSNARNAGCAGSKADTIYWTWIADDHGCAVNNNAVGTGCRDRRPKRRFNFLFVR